MLRRRRGGSSLVSGKGAPRWPWPGWERRPGPGPAAHLAPGPADSVLASLGPVCPPARTSPSPPRGSCAAVQPRPRAWRPSPGPAVRPRPLPFPRACVSRPPPGRSGASPLPAHPRPSPPSAPRSVRSPSAAPARVTRLCSPSGRRPGPVPPPSRPIPWGSDRTAARAAPGLLRRVARIPALGAASSAAFVAPAPMSRGFALSLPAAFLTQRASSPLAVGRRFFSFTRNLRPPPRAPGPDLRSFPEARGRRRGGRRGAWHTVGPRRGVPVRGRLPLLPGLRARDGAARGPVPEGSDPPSGERREPAGHAVALPSGADGLNGQFLLFEFVHRKPSLAFFSFSGQILFYVHWLCRRFLGSFAV